MVSSPHLIGLDWGSSSLRAMLIGAEAQVLETRLSKQGASALSGGVGAFGAALDALIGDWSEELPILACGMVGSQHGWREVPYANCPADAVTLATGALTVEWRGRTVRLLPGLRCHFEAGAGGTPDVMRGEETQVLGALHIDPALTPRACIVMPGTHSKWAEVRDGRVRGFATHMTGELFAVLRQHSVLGRLMSAESGELADDWQAFAHGVKAAHEEGEQGLSHQLFSVRTLGLSHRMEPASLPDYLSGLLIGHELRAALRWRDQHALNEAPLRLIGEAPLCRRYAQALALFGVKNAQALPNTAAAGLWRLAQIAERLS